MTPATPHAVVRGVVCLTVLWLALSGPARAAENGPRLRVVYHPPTLSVEARDVPLAQVLEAIGARLGFTVVDTGGTRQGLTISLEDMTLDDVLRRLLQGENHALIYGPAGGATRSAIDTIVLSGPSPSAAPAPGGRPLARSEARIGLEGAPTRAPGSSPADQPPIREDGGRKGDRGEGEDGADVRVEDLLRSHALSGREPPTGGTPSAAVPPTVSPPAPSPTQTPDPGSSGGLPSDVEKALAITTRRAQETLRVLVDGLAAATRSLHRSP